MERVAAPRQDNVRAIAAGETPAMAPWIPGASLVVPAVALYFWRLGNSPLFVGGDEAQFAFHADAIARTGRDVNGRFLPLFFQIDPGTCYQPILVYLMAPVVHLPGTLRSRMVMVPALGDRGR
jgi:hypothetical protein